MGVWVGGHRPASLKLFYDDSFLNLQHFDTKLMGAAQRGKKLRSKNGQKWILRGLKLRGLTLNQINTPYLIYEIDLG